MLDSPPAAFDRMCESFPTSVPSEQPEAAGTVNFHTSGPLVESRKQDESLGSLRVFRSLSCLGKQHARSCASRIDGREQSTEAPALAVRGTWNQWKQGGKLCL